MRTLRVLVMFLICAIASPVMGPPIVNRSGYFYNLDPQKNYPRVSRPFHPIMKGQKPQIEGTSPRVFGLHDLKNYLRGPRPFHPILKGQKPNYLRGPRPFHPILKGQKPKIEGASPRVFGLHDLKYLVAKSDTPVFLKVAYFITLGCVITGIYLSSVSLFYFLKQLFSRLFTGAPEPQMIPEEIIMQHM